MVSRRYDLRRAVSTVLRAVGQGKSLMIEILDDTNLRT